MLRIHCVGTCQNVSIDIGGAILLNVLQSYRASIEWFAMYMHLPDQVLALMLDVASGPFGSCIACAPRGLCGCTVCVSAMIISHKHLVLLMLSTF